MIQIIDFAKDKAHDENADVRRASLELLVAISDASSEFEFLIHPLLVSRLSDSDLHIRKILADFWCKAYTEIPCDVQSALRMQLCIELNVPTEGTSSKDLQDLFELYRSSDICSTASIFQAVSITNSSLDEMLADIFIHHGCECIELDLD
jgi:hypothetical protein